jgi:rfaE bifunctional protein kinase chain/domain
MPRPAKPRLQKVLARFGAQRVLVLGDLMLDHFVRGKVARISPEAPVPVVQVSTETHAPGGAGNVCSNLSALGAQVTVFSVLGDDIAGNQLLRDLEDRGVNTAGVLLDNSRVTTQKCRVVAEHQQVVRFDRETQRTLAPQNQKKLLIRLKSALATAQALVISDYGKGIVTSGVVQQALQLAHRAGVPVLVDPKVEHFKRYKGVDCMTPNHKEACEGMHLKPSTDDKEIRELGARILKTLRLRSVLITRGEKGMTLFEAAGAKPRVHHIPTQAKEVFDVTGAGDTVISVMALALAARAKLPDAALLANIAAGIVVGKLSTATVTAPEIKKGITEWARRVA